MAEPDQYFQNPRILGHEFSGIVEQKGSQVHHLAIGDLVTAHPESPCGECPNCQAEFQEYCTEKQFLGIHHHGAFAEYVRVNANQCYPLPSGLNVIKGAYTEPLAAGLAVTNHHLEPHWNVLIDGNNRFSKLIGKILKYHNVSNIHYYRQDKGETYTKHSYHLIIETGIRPDFIHHMLPFLSAKGKMLIRSRNTKTVSFSLPHVIHKEPNIQIINYGSFQQAIEWLDQDKIDLQDIFGKSYSIPDYREAFTMAKNESFKCFFKFD